MYLLVHASVGAVVGNALGTPAESFAAGMVSHFALDILPHGDETLGRQFVDKRRHHWLAFLFVVDALAGLSVVTVGWMLGLFSNPVGAYLGAVGAMVPDLLSGVSMVTEGKFLPPFDNFHFKNHQRLKLEAPVLVGGSLQLITLFSIWVIPLVLTHQ